MSVLKLARSDMGCESLTVTTCTPRASSHGVHCAANSYVACRSQVVSAWMAKSTGDNSPRATIAAIVHDCTPHPSDNTVSSAAILYRPLVLYCPAYLPAHFLEAHAPHGLQLSGQLLVVASTGCQRCPQVRNGLVLAGQHFCHVLNGPTPPLGQAG